jgi:hypothetical protein
MKLILLFTLSIICQVAVAQQLYRGMVVDSATFSGLPNVNVQIKGQFKGTVTDVKGNFSLMAKPSDTLVFTLVGYNRTEVPLIDYEASMIRMSQKETYLAAITIHDNRLYANPYQGMFDDQNQLLRKRIPFYYSKARKDKIKAANWREESLRVQTYINVVINDPKTKNGLMETYKLTEKEYYDILTLFNEQHYEVMYFLTGPELTSLISRFFEANAPGK